MLVSPQDTAATMIILADGKTFMIFAMLIATDGICILSPRHDHPRKPQKHESHRLIRLKPYFFPLSIAIAVMLSFQRQCSLPIHTL